MNTENTKRFVFSVLMAQLEGVTLTEKRSYATVILTKQPSGFLIEFPKNLALFKNIVNIEGALFGDESPYETRSFFVPRHQLQKLRLALGNKAEWRPTEELQKDMECIQLSPESLQDVLERLSPIQTPFMKIDPYNFQKLAVAWAAEDKGEQKIKGGLLGDQMGLGKTIEGIAIAGYFKQQGWIKNCLLVTLATVKTQFAQEIEKFTNEKAIVIKSKSGKGFESRKKLYDQIREEKPFFTVINYELLYQKEVLETVVVKKNKKTGKETKKKVYGDYLDLKQLLDIGYDMIIIDEAHKMKNPNTETAAAIRQIDTKYKLLMTGTPIQKELKNIFQLFDYIDPNILSDSSLPFEKRKEQFEKQFLINRINPFTRLPKDLSKLDDSLIQTIGEMNEEALRRKFNPFLLRRKTEDVAGEMPDENIIDTVVEFNSEQLAVLDKIQETIDAYKKDMENEKDEEKRAILENMMKGLLQTRMIVCDSPSLLLESQSPIIKRLAGKKKKFARVQKMERLLELVEEIIFDNKEKVVIFSKYARTTDLLHEEITNMIEKRAKSEGIQPYKALLYQGKTPAGCRYRDTLGQQGKDVSKAICTDCPFFNECGTRTKAAYLFQNDPQYPVIIMTDSGSTGVNLQTGKHLINYDFPDEFAIYLQRNGRIRRLGSKHDQIFIYNMFTKGGKDEQVYKAINKQISISDKVIENNFEDEEMIRKANEEISKVIEEL